MTNEQICFVFDNTNITIDNMRKLTGKTTREIVEILKGYYE